MVLPPEIKPKKTKNGGANPPRKQGKTRWTGSSKTIKWSLKISFHIPFYTTKRGIWPRAAAHLQ